MSGGTDHTRYVAEFMLLGKHDVDRAGGKGAGLGELTRAGAKVPPGCVVTTAAFELAVDDSVRATARRLAAGDVDDTTALADAAAKLRRRVESAPLPPPVREAIGRHYRELDAAPVAVRSSATAEDGADASFAGLQDTYLWVRGEQAVCDAVRRCWASLYSAESLTYRGRRGLPEDGLSMAVVVQRMVEPKAAGVMFTRSPLTGDRSVIAVEGCWGLGSALVSGDVTPDSFVVNKVTGEVLSRSVPAKLRLHRMDPSGSGVLADDVPAELREMPCLSDGEIGELVRLGRAIERHFGCPQDIEWAITEAGEVFLLQSRPETVWAAREQPPVAVPKARAFDHVLDLLGGGA